MFSARPRGVPTLPFTPATGRTSLFGPLGDMPGVVSFAEGTHNGHSYSPEQIAQLVRNFAKFSTPDPEFGNTWYSPYISINHEEDGPLGLRFGTVTGCRHETLPDGRRGVVLDGSDVPELVAKLIEGGQLSQPSIEVFSVERDPVTGEETGFKDRNGNLVREPVLKCLTLLGDLPPAVKGLPDLPAVQFSARTPSRRFGERVETMQSRQEIIEALKALGFPVEMITGDVADEFLAGVLKTLQSVQAQAGATANPAAGAAADVPQQFAQADGASLTIPAGMAGAATGGVSNGSQPKSVTMKFADASSAAAMAGVLNGVFGRMAGLQTVVARTSQASEAQQLADRRRIIGEWGQRMTGAPGADGKPRPAYMLPAQFNAIAPGLEKFDHVTARKYADGKGTGSALSEELHNLESAFSTPLRTLGVEKLPDPSQDSRANRTPAAGGYGGGDDKAAVLAGMGGYGEKIAAKK